MNGAGNLLTDDQCKDPNANCTGTTGSYTCTCKSGYHPEGTGTAKICVASKYI